MQIQCSEHCHGIPGLTYHRKEGGKMGRVDGAGEGQRGTDAEPVF